MSTREPQNSSVVGSNSEAPRGAGLSQSEEMDVRAAARSYIESGFKVVPIPRGQKAPNLRGWSSLNLDAAAVEKYFRPRDNIGLILGGPSGGLVDVDLDSPQALHLADDFLPDTGMVHGREGSPRSHRWYLASGEVLSKKFQGFSTDGGRCCLAEIRSTGGQTVVPPSVHPSGEAVRWYADGEPARLSPDEIVQAVSRLASCALIAQEWPRAKGNRQDLALALAGYLLRGDLDEATVTKLIGRAAHVAGDEEWKDRSGAVASTARRLAADGTATGGRRVNELLPQGERLLEKLSNWLGLARRRGDPAGSAQPSTAAEVIELTDLGNAKRLVERHGSKLRYVPELGRWLVWNGYFWSSDDSKEVERLAKETVESIAAESTTAPSRERRGALEAHARRSASGPKIREMVRLAQSESGVVVSAAGLDADPWLLNCDNGTVDLRTGELRQPSRDHLMTKTTGVSFDPNANCPLWESFLWRVLGGDEDLIRFVQKALGYSLTGKTNEQVLFFLHGGGANGKSTFLETIRAMLGDYACQADFSTLLVGQPGRVRNDIARLRGARFVTATEVGADDRLDEVLVKQITGGDVVAARLLYQEAIEFKPDFKLFLGANHRPRIRGTDEGIWRRIHLIPFGVAIPQKEQDRELLGKLSDETPGILRWALEGCLLWQKHGLTPPGRVRRATEQYRTEMDDVALFLKECCVREPNLRTQAKTLFDAYLRWAECEGRVPFSPTKFGQRLTESGLEKKKSSGIQYLGVGVRREWEPWESKNKPVLLEGRKESGNKPPTPPMPSNSERPSRIVDAFENLAAQTTLAEASPEGGSR